MSTYEAITLPGWPKHYTVSSAVRVGNMLFISGTTAWGEKGQIVAPDDIVGQTRDIFQKFAKILASVGAGFEHIVETTEYITTTENYKKTADVRREFFKEPFPTATGVIVKGLLRKGALIEISAVAIIPG